MGVFVILALMAGCVCGFTGIPLGPLEAICANSDMILYLLLFCVGFALSLNREALGDIRTHAAQAVAMPACIMLTAIIGGAICASLVGCTVREGIAIAAGAGWYSYAGVAVESMAGAQLGTIALLSNMIREIFAITMMPLIARFFGNTSCIAAAGSSSGDTVLPVITRYTDETTSLMSIINGAVCALLVPLVISLALGGIG